MDKFCETCGAKLVETEKSDECQLCTQLDWRDTLIIRAIFSVAEAIGNLTASTESANEKL